MWTFFEHAFQIGCFIELKPNIIMMSLEHGYDVIITSL